jgi:phosphatidylglycerophosphate synthase
LATKSNLNPANAITASRFLCLPVFFYAVERGDMQLAMLATLICGVLDKLDGLAAKIFDCKTPFGEIFDGIADGICWGVLITALPFYDMAPAGPVFAIVGLGVFNLVLRLVYARRAGRTVNYRSYAMERLVAYAAFLVGFACADFMVTYFYWLFLGLMTITMIHDTKRMLLDPIPAAAPPSAVGAVGAVTEAAS